MAGTVLMVQAMFRKLAEETAGKLREPHVRDYVNGLAGLAAQQEHKTEQLLRVIGRSLWKGRELSGSLMAKDCQEIADVQGVLDGAESGWRDLHQLLLGAVNAISAFAMAQQLGLALGLPEIVEVTFPVVQQLSTAQNLLQKFLLEMAPPAVLYCEPT